VAAPRDAEIAARKIMVERAYRIKATPMPAPPPRNGPTTNAATYGRPQAQTAAMALRMKTRCGQKKETVVIASPAMAAMVMTK
jgi:hypothetical protein